MHPECIAYKQRHWGLDKILCDLVKIMMINERNARSVFQAAAQRDQYASQSPDHNHHLLSKGTFPQGVGQQLDPTNHQNTMTYIEMWKWRKICV